MIAFINCCGKVHVLELQRRGRHTFAKCPTCGRCWYQVKRAIARSADLRATGGTAEMRSFAESQQ